MSEIKTTIIEISDENEKYRELGNNYRIPNGLIIDNVIYTSVLNYIYSNLILNKSYKQELRINENLPKTTTRESEPNEIKSQISKLHNIYSKRSQEEYIEYITDKLEKIINVKIEKFPDFKRELLKINKDYEIIYNSESSILGKGTDSNGLNLYGIILKKILNKVSIDELQEKETSYTNKFNKLIYNLYIIYNYLIFLIKYGKDILAYESKPINDIISIIDKDKVFKDKVPIDKFEVVISNYKQNILPDILSKEIDRLNLIGNKDIKLDYNDPERVKYVSKEFILEIRNNYILIGLENLKIIKSNIIFNTYFKYIIRNNYNQFIPLEKSKLFYEDAKLLVFKSILDKENGKLKYQKLVNKIVNLYELDVFDEELKKEIDFILKDYNLKQIHFEDDEISSVTTDEYDDIQSSKEEDSVITPDPDKISRVSSSIASSVNPIKDDDDPDIVKKNYPDIIKKVSLINKKEETTVFIEKDSILSPSYISPDNKMIVIKEGTNNNNYPSIIHFIIKNSIEYILKIYNIISSNYTKVSKLTDDELSNKAYTYILYSTNFVDFDIINKNIVYQPDGSYILNKTISIHLNSGFIQLNTLNYIYNRISYVLNNKSIILLLEKALYNKFNNDRMIRILLSTKNNKLVYNYKYNSIIGTGPPNYVNPYYNSSNTTIDEYLSFSKVDNYETDYTSKILTKIRYDASKSINKIELYSDKVLSGFLANPEIIKWIENKTKDINNIIISYSNYLTNINKKILIPLSGDIIKYILNDIFEKCIDLNKMKLVNIPDFYMNIFNRLVSLENKRYFNNDIKLIIWSFIYNIIYDVIGNTKDNKPQLFLDVLQLSENNTLLKTCKSDNCYIYSIISLLTKNREIKSKLTGFTRDIKIIDINLVVNIILSKSDFNLSETYAPSKLEISNIKQNIKDNMYIQNIDDEIALYIYNCAKYIEEYKMDDKIKMNRLKYFAFGNKIV